MKSWTRLTLKDSRVTFPAGHSSVESRVTEQKLHSFRANLEKYHGFRHLDHIITLRHVQVLSLALSKASTCAAVVTARCSQQISSLVLPKNSRANRWSSHLRYTVSPGPCYLDKSHSLPQNEVLLPNTSHSRTAWMKQCCVYIHLDRSSAFDALDRT